MDIRIDNSSEVPIRHQLAEQIVFLIATNRLAAGEALPSVREMARRLKIHHNTVSDAYQDLVRRNWLARRRGSRLVVAPRETLRTPEDVHSLDDLINATIRMAHSLGYSLQTLREIMREELRAATPWRITTCSRDDLGSNGDLAIGALAITPQHAIEQVDALFPKDRPVVPVSFSTADEHLKRIRGLPEPSTIAVVSVSKVFLAVARSLLAPALGKRHSLREILLPNEKASMSRSADIIFCDSIANQTIRSPRAIHYHLLSSESVNYAANVMRSYAVKLDP